MRPMFHEFSSERNFVSRLYISGSPPKVEFARRKKRRYRRPTHPPFENHEG